jgi:hypothetical protein
MELLALAVEEISVVASAQQRKKPIKIPRPDHIAKPNRRREQPRPGGGGESNVVEMAGYRNAVSVLARSSKHVVT